MKTRVRVVRNPRKREQFTVCVALRGARGRRVLDAQLPTGDIAQTIAGLRDVAETLDRARREAEKKEKSK